ncbi:hypothetical protein BC830DRAFT_747043 [Chytriomyces sp. MP71]|nr:hypothetical protein BC830DRAFT_747043 [Chytriomyces sp. MP71]
MPLSAVADATRHEPRGGQSSPAPEIVIHYPDEDEIEATLSYAAPDAPTRLGNAEGKRSVGLANALLHLLGATDEITHSLPLAAADSKTAAFASFVRRMHGSRPQCRASGDAVDAGAELRWWLDSFSADANRGRDEDDGEGVALVAGCVQAAVASLIENTLSRTAFGRCFTAVLDRTPPLGDNVAAPDSAVEMSASKQSCALTIPLERYAESDSIDLLSLLRIHFGIKPPPAFFFGFSGPARPQPPIPKTCTDAESPDLNSNRTVSPIPPTPSSPVPPAPLYTTLPHLFLILLHRPTSASNPATLHRTSIEVPLDLDLGFLLTPAASRANAAANKHVRQNTFYKLHGFVTQTEGRCLCYTKMRGAPWGGWWKAEDDSVVGGVDLGNRVNSKGVIVLLYRVQEAKK